MRESPLPGAFAITAPPARYMPPSDGNHFHKGTIPMAIPMERVVENLSAILVAIKKTLRVDIRAVVSPTAA